MSRRACGLLAWTFTWWSLGCTPPSQPARGAAAERPRAPAQLRDEGWARFRSQRQGLSVPFPVGQEWRIDDHSSDWLDAKHPSTDTRLRARVWHEPTVMSRQRCEQQARARSAGLPELDAASIIDEVQVEGGPQEPAADWRGLVGTGGPVTDTSGLWGYVLSFGASGRTCVATVFETRVQGAGGSEVLASRLELGVRMLEGIVLRTRLPAGPMEPATGGAQR